MLNPNFKDMLSALNAADVDGVSAFVIGRNELIQNKTATGRPKDLLDVDALNSDDSFNS